MRPLLLDLFCGAGGAAMGYHNAGFDVIGVDNKPQPHYPFEFIQENALWALPLLKRAPDAVHASPPCQVFSLAQVLMEDETHLDLIGPTRKLLQELGVPYVIENVPGSPLQSPILLCGSMFPELRVYRHRIFECSIPVPAPPHRRHLAPQVKMGRQPKPGEFHQPVGNFIDAAYARTALGTPWMVRKEMAQAIPPAYTEHIGRQLIVHV